MPSRPPEPDWTHLKQLARLAEERFCRQALAELAALLENEELSCRARYLDAQDLLKRRHQDLVWAFGGLCRSRALDHLMAFYSMGLLRKGEVAEFTEAIGARLEQELAAGGTEAAAAPAAR